jgi:hypothetical protein
MKSFFGTLFNAVFIVVCIYATFNLQKPKSANSPIPFQDFSSRDVQPNHMENSLKLANIKVHQANKATPKYSEMYNQLLTVCSNNNPQIQDLDRIRVIINNYPEEYKILVGN